MKVAFLLGTLNRGGTETLILDSFKRADDAEFEIIGVYRKKGDLYDEFISTDVPLFELRPKNFLDFKYFINLRKLLRNNSIKIVHAQQPLDAFYAYFACLFTGIKIVLTLHGYGKRDTHIGRMIRKFIIKRTDLNIYVSDSQRRHYIRNYSIKPSMKQRVLYNGINFNKLKNSNGEDVRQELGIPQNHLLLGTVGSFVAVRDQMTICRFLHLLDKTGTAFTFIFTGAKDEAEPWRYEDCVEYCNENGLSKKVFFLGIRNDVPNVLKQLDAFIYASNHDTFGIAVIEAMSIGLPVFVNDWEVMIEITNQKEHGIFYKTKNEQDLFNKFMDFIQQKEKYLNKAKSDAEWVRQRYGITYFLTGLNKNYNDLLK